MDKRTYYYARVSSKSQNLARQIEAFKKDGANDHDIITEQQSGKNMDRPEYQAQCNVSCRGQYHAQDDVPGKQQEQHEEQSQCQRSG